MFTGIIEGTAKVAGLKVREVGATLTVAMPVPQEPYVIGESVAIDGACLTVARMNGAECAFELSSETLRKTTIGEMKRGRRVNYERALKPSSRMGGHFVTGHVDCVGEIASVRREGEGLKAGIRIENALLKYLAAKGSVAVDGISLTVAGLDKTGFIVYIIPHTLSVTNMDEWKAGRRVNVETDILAKYVERAIGKTGGVTLEGLARAGFTERNGD
jgi:riboflavin synthase